MVLKIKKKKLIFSALLWSVLNAGIVLLIEKIFHSVTADVVVSTAFSMLWVLFAVMFCRHSGETQETEE